MGRRSASSTAAPVASGRDGREGTAIERRPDITLLLARAHAGDRGAMDGVARAVQSDLLRCARKLMAARPGPPGRPITLEPVELVNETFVKLLEQRTRLRDREHFFAIATRVMLRVLLDYHRARGRRKRAGATIHLSLGALGARGAAAPRAEVPEVVVALDGLGRLDPRAARVVELRVLWGLSKVETASVLGVSKATVERDWRFARAWLLANL